MSVFETVYGLCRRLCLRLRTSNTDILIKIHSVSTQSRIIGLFCKRALQNRLYSAKETCNLIDPTKFVCKLRLRADMDKTIHLNGYRYRLRLRHTHRHRHRHRLKHRHRHRLRHRLDTDQTQTRHRQD